MPKEGLKQFDIESEENSGENIEKSESLSGADFPSPELSESKSLEEKTKEVAQRIYEQRMSGKGRKPKETIDKMLEARGIEPWTSEAEEFMGKWDWEQAEKLVKIQENEGEKKTTEKSQKEILQDDLWKKRFSYIEEDIAFHRVDKVRGEKSGRIFGIFSRKKESLKLQASKAFYEESLAKYGRYLYENKKELGLSEADIFQKIIINEQNGLAKEHVANREPFKQTWFRKLMADYVSMPLWKRVAISSAIVTGLLATGGALGLSGVAAATFIAPAKFGTIRLVRGLLGAKMAALTGGFVKIYKTRKAEEYRKKETADIKNLFGIQIGEIDSEAEFRQLFAGISEEYQEIIKEVNKKHKNASRWAAAAAIGAGGLTAGALAMTNLDGPLSNLINNKLGFAGHEIHPLRVNVESFSGGRVYQSLPEELSFKGVMEPGGQKMPAGEKLFEEIPKIKNVPADVGAGKIGTDRLLELATIKKNEGVWHAIYRQLEDRLHQNPSKFGLRPEDLEDADRIKNVLNNQTGKLLVDQGYIKAGGREIGITRPGVKVFLDPDNNIRIEDGNNPIYEWNREVDGITKTVDEGFQTEQVAAEIMPEQTAVETVQPEAVQTMAAPEALPAESEISVAPETEISSFPEKIVENTDYGVKGIFRYMANGDISDVSVSSPLESQWKQVSKLLNKNWEDILEHRSTPVHPEQIESFKNGTKTLFQYNQLLKTLESIGKSDSLEADFLRVKIYKLVEKTEEIYGDVFNKKNF